MMNGSPETRRVELRTHSTASDGELEPERAVELVAERGAEVGHPDHTDDDIVRYTEMADEFGLVQIYHRTSCCGMRSVRAGSGSNRVAVKDVRC